MVEGATQSIRLEDLDVSTFGALVHWLYTQEIEEGFWLHNQQQARQGQRF